MTTVSNTLDALKYFIDHQMRGTSVYQPVLIRTLLQVGEPCDNTVIDKEVELENPENKGRNRSTQALRNRGWIEYTDGYYSLTIDLAGATETDVNGLIRSCDLRIKAYHNQTLKGAGERRKYFSLFVNDRVYRIEDAMVSIDQDWWATRGRILDVGDRVLFWKTGTGEYGALGTRGIVGFGEVVSHPKNTNDPKSQYWVDPWNRPTTEERVLVKYLPPRDGPLWVQLRISRLSLSVELYPFLHPNLSLPTASGTVFNISEEDWEEIIDLAGGWPGDEPNDHQKDQMFELQDELGAAGEFDPSGVEDGRRKTYQRIALRRGQHAFRENLLEAYEGRCAFTGYDLTDALEACHIVPYQGPYTNHVTNGLLLRADIHTLFDIGKMAVRTSNMTLIIADELKEGSYGYLSERPITLPIDPVARPNVDALNQHRELVGL